MNVMTELFRRRVDRPHVYDVHRGGLRGLHPGSFTEREKFACFDCRRVFSHVLRQDNCYTRGRPLLVSPCSSRVLAICRTAHKLRDSQISEDQETWAYVKAGIQQHWDSLYKQESSKSLDQEELDDLKQLTPEAWWKKFEARCPSCGKAGHRVSTIFKAPPQKSLRAWKRASEWVKGGGEWKGWRDKDREVAEERWNRGQRSQQRVEGDKEKQTQAKILQEAVKLGVYTSEEERRLTIIRRKKGSGRRATGSHDTHRYHKMIFLN